MNNSTFGKVLGKGGKFYDEVSSPETFGNIKNIKAIAVVDGKPSTTTDYETFTPIVPNQLEQDVETLKTDVEELGTEQNQTANDLTNEISAREQADTALQSDINTRAKLDASNLTDENVSSFVNKLAYDSNDNERINAVGFAEEERQKSKNLYTVGGVLEKTVSGVAVKFDKEKEQISFNGTATSAFSVGAESKCNVELNKGTYTLSIKTKGTITNGSYKVLYFYFKNGTQFETINIPTTNGGIASKTVSLSIDEILENISFDISNGCVFNDCIFEIQIEEGSTVTDYQPYNGAIVHEKGTLTTPTAGSTLNGVAHVVESYLSSDGLTWYRKWSDGWKECGGIATGRALVTFPLSFINLPVGVHLTKTGDENVNLESPPVVNSLTKSSFIIVQADLRNQETFYYAYGY